tara:strand:- start:15506 stop:16627 length:1122 start_codon:yes stop_codon:yes gene_type:complete
MLFVLLRSLVDFNGIGEFISYAISPGGGILIHTMIGSLLVAQQNYLANYSNPRKVRKILNIIFLATLIIIVSVMFQILQNINESIFLLDILKGYYQAPGKALIMLIIFLQISIINLNLQAIKTTFADSIFLIIAVISLFCSQGFGSNTAFIIILFMTINFFIFKALINKKSISRLLLLPLPEKVGLSFFSRSFQSLLTNQLLVFLLILIFILVIAFNYFYEYLALFRIFSFGDFASYDSITSRYELLSNFVPQAEIGILFGNLASDLITTGSGTYPHSFSLSLLTHTGLFGTVIFLFFFINYVNSLFRLKLKNHESINNVKAHKYFLIITMAMIFIYSNLATFFSWVPLWFFFGCTINMFNFQTYEKSISSSS